MGMDELTRWNIVSVEVTESESDHRDESYKISGSKKDWDHLFEKVEKVGELPKPQRIQLTNKLANDCTAVLNENHASLGMVEPDIVHDIEVRDIGNTPTQIDLSGRKLMGKNDFENKLYIDYECVGCKQKTTHNQHVIEWGVYEFWKNHDDPDEVVDALRLNNDGWKHYFFVGNLRHNPTAYIIISVLRFKKTDMIDAGVRPDNQAGLGDF